MGSSHLRRALAAVVAGCACAVSAAPASAAPPRNDSAATPNDIVLTLLNGVRNAAYDTALGGVVFGVDTSEATTSPEDPILKNDLDQSNCNSVPTQGGDTVFYRLRGPDGGPLKERTAITIDTTGSTYPTALAVYHGSISPAGLIRCERGNLAAGAASVDVVTDGNPAADYFVEVASTNGSGTMNLFVRPDDVQAPMVAVTARAGLAEPGKTTEFTAITVDEGSGLVPGQQIQWSATFTLDGGNPVPVPVTVFDDGARITVRWPSGNKVIGRGTAVARASDAAGNPGHNALTVRVKDRTPPKLTLTTYRTNARRHTIAATIRCDEAGTADILLRVGGRKPRSVTIRGMRGGVRRTIVFGRVPTPAAFAIDYRCTDSRGNSSRVRTLADLIGI